MSERIEKFQVTGAPRLALRLPAGEVRVVAGDPGEVVVRARGSEADLGRLAMTAQGNSVSVEMERSGWGRWAAVDLEIAVADGAEVSARQASGNLILRTPVDEVNCNNASGGVEAGVVRGRLTARLASGDLRVEAAGGLDVVSASGDVAAGRVDGSASVKSASGDVTLGRVGGDLTVRTASGDVVVGCLEGSRLDVKTVSGDVRVGVPAGRRYAVSAQTLSGRVRTEFPVSAEGGGAPGRLAVNSVSGDITFGAAG